VALAEETLGVETAGVGVEMVGEENDEVGGVREEEDMEDGFCEWEEGG
jgi:hypothetical protein